MLDGLDRSGSRGADVSLVLPAPAGKGLVMVDNGWGRYTDSMQPQERCGGAAAPFPEGGFLQEPLAGVGETVLAGAVMVTGVFGGGEPIQYCGTVLFCGG